MIMKQKYWLPMVLGAFVFALSAPGPVAAQWSPEQRAGRLQLGADIGPVFGTADSTAFGLALHGDYFLHQNFSIGPLLQFGFTRDLFQVGPSVQLKYTYDINSRLKGNLQGGIGFIYADLDRRGRRSRDDTSYLIPVGGGIDYRITDWVSVGGTLLLNFTDLDRVRNEKFHAALLGGLKVRF
jgi:hypothetical protein